MAPYEYKSLTLWGGGDSPKESGRGPQDSLGTGINVLTLSYMYLHYLTCTYIILHLPEDLPTFTIKIY